MREQLAAFNVLRVTPIWTGQGHTGMATAEFSKDWSGFNDGMDFEMHFAEEGLTKSNWLDKKVGNEVCGWLARSADYHSDSVIGDYIRRYGDLKSIYDAEKEVVRKTDVLVTNLAGVIEDKNKSIEELEVRYELSNISLTKVSEERDQLLESMINEMNMLHQRHDRHLSQILRENAELNSDLEQKMKELGAHNEHLDDLAAHNGIDKQKFEQEKLRNAKKNQFLQKATQEQQKADEKVFKLIEEHKQEKQIVLEKILQLQKELEAKQNLEMEIKQLRSRLEVMKHMGDADDSTQKSKMDELTELLDEKIEEMEDQDSLNQTLIIKEQKCAEELQEARKELMQGLTNMEHGHIHVKMIGELDVKAFQKNEKSQKEYKFWQSEVKNAEWNPFGVYICDGQEKVFVEDDAKLLSLRNDLGDGPYQAVKKALLELKCYNPSGRFVIPEIWNYKEDRSAPLMETVRFLIHQSKSCKRKR